MQNMWKKLLSRKLWVALAGIATGAAMALGVSQSEVVTVAGAVTTALSAVSYVISEGKIDAEAVRMTAKALEQAADCFPLMEGEDGTETENS